MRAAILLTIVRYCVHAEACFVELVAQKHDLFFELSIPLLGSMHHLLILFLAAS